jgi:hypothetical protein
VKLARFGNARTKKGSLRHDRNAIAVTGIEADYDGGSMTFDEAVEILGGAGVDAIVYTSPSHTDERPRWRVLCPFSSELSPDRRQHMMGRLNGLFRGLFAVESWTLSQAYFFGAVNGNPAHRVETVEGAPIDLCDELDKIWRGKPDTAKPQSGNSHFEKGPVDENALLAAIINGESYHASCTRLAGKWAQESVPFLDAQQRLYDAFERVDAFGRDARWQQRRDDVPRIVRDIYGAEARKQDGTADAINPRAPYDVARLFVEQNFTVAGRRTLHRHRGGFYHWNGAAYPEVEEDCLRSRLYEYLARRMTRQQRPIKPNAAMVGNILDALRAASHLDAAVETPAWLDHVPDLPAAEMVVCANGLLHLPTLALLPLTPAFFAHNALGFAYAPMRQRRGNGSNFSISYGQTIKRLSRPCKKSSASP